MSKEKITKIVIEVRGGVIVSVSSNEAVECRLIDYDEPDETPLKLEVVQTAPFVDSIFK
jgi:hypothetical protein